MNPIIDIESKYESGFWDKDLTAGKLKEYLTEEGPAFNEMSVEFYADLHGGEDLTPMSVNSIELVKHKDGTQKWRIIL